MPIVDAQIPIGYSADEKSGLAAALRDAILSAAPGGDSTLSVSVREMARQPSDHAATPAPHGSPPSSGPAGPDPKRTALDFLAALEARDIQTAEAMLADDCRMVFPGARPMASIAELIDWARDRYRFVKKTITATEVLHQDGFAVVYVRGTLSGEWPNGDGFDGVRFIDRFEIKNGVLVSQDVWNDLAEERPR